jgi:hypothetical protein
MEQETSNQQGWARNFKKFAPQKQNAMCKHRAQNAIALLNFLERIAPQQLMLRTQVLTKKIKCKERKRNFFK